MPAPRSAADTNNSHSPWDAARRGPWPALGILAAALINLAVAGVMTCLAVSALEEAREEKQAAHFLHSALSVTTASLAATALLCVAAGLAWRTWNGGRRGRPLILWAAIAAGCAGVAQGLLASQAPLTGSSDFRAMEGFGRSLVAFAALASTGIVSLVNGLFLALTRQRSAATP